MKKWAYHLARCLLFLIPVLLLCSCSGDDDSGPLFQDDFEDPDSGWGMDQRGAFDRGYRSGEYYFQLHRPNWFAWARPGKVFGDARVEVNAYLSSGAQDAHFGVLCRHVDRENFYYFAISGDGYYAIFRRLKGDMEILTGGGSGMVFSSAIKTGGEVNAIQAVCEGKELSLYVNGALLASVSDDALSAGDVGIGVGSGAGGDALVRFEDLVVEKP